MGLGSVFKKAIVNPTKKVYGGIGKVAKGAAGMLKPGEAPEGGAMDMSQIMAMMGAAGAMNQPLQPQMQPGQLSQALGPMSGSLIQQPGPPPGQVANTPVPDMMEYMRILQGQGR